MWSVPMENTPDTVPDEVLIEVAATQGTVTPFVKLLRGLFYLNRTT